MTRNRLSDAELDAMIVGAISRLPSFGPRRGFADRVLWRARLPGPRAVVPFARLRRWALSPRRSLVLSGCYVAGLATLLALLVPWLAANGPAIQYALHWAAETSQTFVRDVALSLAAWAVSSPLSGAVNSFSLSWPLFVLAALTLPVGYTAAAVGLHFLLRAPRRSDVPVRVRA